MELALLRKGGEAQLRFPENTCTRKRKRGTVLRGEMNTDLLCQVSEGAVDLVSRTFYRIRKELGCRTRKGRVV